MAKREVSEAFEKVVFQIEEYSRERRATTQPFHLDEVEKQFPNYTYNQHDAVVREPLIEHVGALPIIATALYPYVNDEDVNLGEALIMMAIHDIGELETGDENTFTKTAASNDAEYEAAIRLLDPSYHAIYKRVEKQSDNTGKFAKSIDKIAPDFIDYLTPAGHTLDRFKSFTDVKSADELIALVRKHKSPYMTWNPFLVEVHEYLMEQTHSKLRAFEIAKK